MVIRSIKSRDVKEDTSLLQKRSLDLGSIFEI